MPVMEDEHGTYIMNSKDLRAVEHVERLVRIGVDSLKIEGRTKSQYYVSRTAQIYRRAIDDAVAGRPFDPSLLLELEGLSNRGYTAGFLERRPSQDYQNYLSGSSQAHRSQFVGEVKSVRADGWAEVETKNRFAVGDTLEVIHPGGNRLVTLGQMSSLDGEAIQVASGSPLRVWVPLGAPVEGALLARLLSSRLSDSQHTRPDLEQIELATAPAQAASEEILGQAVVAQVVLPAIERVASLVEDARGRSAR